MQKHCQKKRTIEEEGHNIILFLFFSFMPFAMRLIVVLVVSNDICSLYIDELKKNKQKTCQ
jgi:hypothetical protein